MYAGLQAYIHPIIPVLDVTRQIVQLFNGLYKEAMSGVKGDIVTLYVFCVPLIMLELVCVCLDLLSTSHVKLIAFFSLDCYWLDMEDQFLESATAGGDHSVLREEYKMDGTHVNPSYVSLLEASLKKVLSA